MRRPPERLLVAGGAAPPPPWDHQRGMTEFCVARRTALLDCGMGVGKSRASIDALDRLGAQRALVVAPLSVLEVWPKQLSTWSPRQWRVAVLGDQLAGVPAKADLLRRAFEVARVERVPLLAAVNYESCWVEPLATILRTAQLDALLLDESHRAKSHDAKSGTFLHHLGRRVDTRLLLTGTPTPLSPLDLFGQFRVLRPEVFGTSWFHFQRRYAVIDRRFGFPKVVRLQRQDELARLAAEWTHHVPRSVLTLTEATHQDVPVHLSVAARRAYDELEEYLCASVAGGTISAPNRLVALLRLEQITGGHVSLDPTDAEGEREVRRVCDAKERALADLLDGLAPEDAVPVFCRFRPDLEAVHRAARASGRASLELSGQRRELARWQAGEAPVLAVQIRSGGVGIDLTRAHHCVFYSVGFDGGDYEQALCRTHRPGQTHPVRYYHLVAFDTVDEVKYRVLGQKRDLSEGLVEEMQRQRALAAA